ncbi:uncharacterized protein ELE39_000532 [Cryptosporidium sp. chipmunk genotype I]|uniref:uncharacterized protein n=1 Tax=Cryptosporidium sp. chipmunk genotype I TaxID=1280935 RepID=UPI00351A9A65|nr:hypothetical protein ELE39_000532 [Cryptosporidium sp. chipmunk genotype I]
MEDESMQQTTIEEELKDETSEFNSTLEINNLELNEESNAESGHFQKDREANELLDFKTSIQESKILNIVEANTNNEKLYVKIKSENVSLKLCVQGNISNKSPFKPFINEKTFKTIKF